MLDKLLCDHVALRAKGQALLALFDQTEAPDPEALARARWDLNSAVMQHLAYEDRHLYAKLLADPRPGVAECGRRFQAELAEMFTAFSAHARHWTPDRIAQDWDGFRARGRQSVKGMFDRIDREERELFPLARQADLDTDSTVPPSRNWTRDAFAIKDSITAGLASHRAAS